MTNLQKLDAQLGRLFEDEEELRRISPMDGVHGKNASDYRHMFDLFITMKEQATIIRADPNAFLAPSGKGYNDKMINAYAKLLGLAMKAMSELNRMRNHDKMTAHILNEHTREFTQGVTVDLSLELRKAVDALKRGEDRIEVAQMLEKLLYRRIPEIFLSSASSALQTTKKEFGLLN